MNRKPTNYKIPEMKDENGEIINETQAPDAFNKYFVELGEKLASKIPHSSISPDSFLTDVDYPDKIIGSPAFKKFLKIMF